MKKTSPVLLAVLIVAVIGGALAVTLPGGKTNTCKSSGTPTHYEVKIENDTASNSSLTVHKCDTMTITNKDSKKREIAFGFHDHHMSYDGVEERELTQGEALTVTFVKAGTYHWHDHLHDEIEGNFTVSG